MSERMSKHVVATVAEIPPGQRKLVTVRGRPIAVFNLQRRLPRLFNRCPHQGGPMCEGVLTGLIESDDPGRLPIFAAPARSCAAPGMAGNSTSAPASPSAIRENQRAQLSDGGRSRADSRQGAVCCRDDSGVGGEQYVVVEM